MTHFTLFITTITYDILLQHGWHFVSSSWAKPRYYYINRFNHVETILEVYKRLFWRVYVYSITVITIKLTIVYTGMAFLLSLWYNLWTFGRSTNKWLFYPEWTSFFQDLMRVDVKVYITTEYSVGNLVTEYPLKCNRKRVLG